MRAGPLDKLVTIQHRTQTRDQSTGELVDTWTTLGDQWAQKMEGAPLERYAAQQKIAEISTGFRMRYSPALLILTPDEHRLMIGEMIYDVKGVVEIQRREGVMVFTEARTEGLTAIGQPPEAE